MLHETEAHTISLAPVGVGYVGTCTLVDQFYDAMRINVNPFEISQATMGFVATNESGVTVV